MTVINFGRIMGRWEKKVVVENLENLDCWIIRRNLFVIVLWQDPALYLDSILSDIWRNVLIRGGFRQSYYSIFNQIYINTKLKYIQL